MATYTGVTDQKHEVHLPSTIARAFWSDEIAKAGDKVRLHVQTKFVKDGSKVLFKIYLANDAKRTKVLRPKAGKANPPEGKINKNECYVDFKVDFEESEIGSNPWKFVFVAEIPDYSLKADSNTLTRVVEAGFEILLQYFDPIAAKDQSAPKGVKVKLLDATDAASPSVIQEVETNDAGRASFPVRKYGMEKVIVQIDFSDTEYLDLECKELVKTAAVQLDDRRKLIRLPKLWDSRKQEKFLDDLGGRFKTGELSVIRKDQQGTASAPWKVRIDFAWDKIYLEFKYYNTESKKAESVSYGVRVEAFSDPAMSDDKLVAASTVLKDDGMVYLAVFTKTDRNKLHLRLRSEPNSYLAMAESHLTRRLKKIDDAQYNQLSGVDKRRLYPMPVLWKSPRQRTLLGADEKPFEDQIKQDTAADKRLTFNLDDFVLVNAAGNPIAWNNNNRFTLFNHLLAIRDPDANEPYLTRNKVATNLFPGEKYYYKDGEGSDGCLRVVGLAGTFYDLVNKRTSKGDVIGVRAAVADDHPHEAKLNYLKDTFGNFDLHYFHDCSVDASSGNPLAHVLVYWSAKFVKKHANVTDADLANFKKGLSAAKIRHEGQHPSDPDRKAGHKNYMLKPRPESGGAAPNPNRTIKIYFHFEGRDNAPFKCTVNVHDVGGKRPWMQLTVCDLNRNDHAPNATSTATDRADGLTYPRFTLAHEIGHALGLLDEYTEPIQVPDMADNSKWAVPRLPRLQQQYEGMPYSCETTANIMYEDRATRMRGYWQFTRWVNETAAVQALLANKKYHIEYPISGGPTLKYFLEDTHKDYYVPIHKQLGFTNGATGKMDLLLFKIGQDETQRYNIKPGTDGYDSILVVQINVYFGFIPNADGTDWTDWPQRKAFMTTFENGAVGLRTAPQLFTLETTADDPFKKCYVYFQPRYEISVPDVHFRVLARRPSATAAKNVPDINNPAFADTRIEVVSNTNNISLLRYMLGLPAVSGSGATASPITSISPADLQFLANWMKAQRGKDYIVRQY